MLCDQKENSDLTMRTVQECWIGTQIVWSATLWPAP